MPYPCCCEPQVDLVKCPACALADDDLPLRMQATLPQVRIYAKQSTFASWAIVQTIAAQTAVFTSTDALVGEAPPYSSCCWAMPPRRICLGPLQFGNQQALEFGATLSLTSVMTPSTQRFIHLNYGIYRRFTVFNNAVPQEIYPCVSLGFQTNYVDSASGSASITVCDDLQSGVSVAVAAQVLPAFSGVSFNCTPQRQQWAIECSAANVSVSLVP